MKHHQKDDAFLIITDMEGISGLIDRRLLHTGGKFWENYGRYLLTEDVNVVAHALYSKGIRRIYLSENHNLGRNVVPGELLPFIALLPPHSANTNMWGTDFWDELYRGKGIKGAILLGFPGMAGSGGYLSHSWDNNVFEHIEVNGLECGGIGTTAFLLGEYDIPVVAVIGDAAAAEEAKKTIPNVTAIMVKETEDKDWIKALPPDKAHELILNGILKALDEPINVAPLKAPRPTVIRFRVKKTEYLKAIDISGVEIKGNAAIIRAPNYIKAYDLFWNCYMKMLFT